MPIFVKHTIGPSMVHDRGTFAGEPIRKGTTVFYWPAVDVHEIEPEDDVVKLMAEDPLVRMSAVRLIGKHFVYSRSNVLKDELFNHSFSPNVLFHLCFGISLRDIQEGEELTIDYRLVNPGDFDAGPDLGTGMDARTATLQSTRTLLEILEAQPDWVG